MIVATRSKAGVRVAEVYFARSPEQLDIDADVIVVTQACFRGPDAAPFTTQWIDLRRPWRDIEAAISKTGRYEIRRASERDRPVLRVAERPTASDVAGFEQAYRVFAGGKGLSPFPSGRLTALAATGGLTLFVARLPDGSQVQHAYLCDDERVRLFASLVTAGQTPVTGRVNRWLHAEAIKWARSTGRVIYDLGGLALIDPRLAGIDAFKASFGGERHTEYSWTTTATIRGRVAESLRARQAR